jgi:23S rRNA (adenine2030-N6)-methyltransferase
MLSYRHAFHAGNHADVLKHVGLVTVLRALARKPAPYFVLDTHAGAGRYALDAPPATVHGEHRDGIERVMRAGGSAPADVAAYLALIGALNPPDGGAAPRVYPGSPLVIAASMREDDRLVCCELHPADADALRVSLAGDARVTVLHADGYATLASVLPPRERRGVVLIDPAYERRDESQRVVAGLAAGLRRFGHGVFALWYPVTRGVPLAELHAGVAASGARKVLRAELCVRADDHPAGLNGSGVLIVNPPHRLHESLAESLAWLHARLAPDGAGRATVDWLVPE